MSNAFLRYKSLRVRRLLSILGLIVVVGVSQRTFADEAYRNELSHSRTNISYQGDTESKLALTAFEYHILPVIPGIGIPRHEAAFLQQSGSVGIEVGDTNTSGSVDASTKDEGAWVTLAEKGKPWVLKWRYKKHKGTASEQSNTDIDAKFTGYGLGYYVSDGVMISLFYDQSDIKLSTIPGKTEGTLYEYALKWVTIRSGQKATNFELSVANAREKDVAGSRDSQLISVSGDYYFTPDTSLGILYSQKSHDNKIYEGTRTEIRMNHFFTPQFFVGANVERFQASHSSGDDSNTQELFIGYRF